MSEVAVLQGLLDGLRPPPRISVGEWANQHRYMTDPFPGLYRTGFTPYLEEIMEQLSPYNPTQEVIFKKSSQIGATQAGNNWIGAIIHHYLGNGLMVLPTKDLATRNSKQNIEKMIEASPELRKRIPPARQRDSGNTTLEKNFPGGFLCICGANSPNSARSTSFRWVYLDEISAYPLNMGGEGDPYKLFKGRTKAFGTKFKVFVTSTPTVEGQCRITSLYEETDQRRYYVPCPHCEEKQPLDFDRLRWEPGEYDDVWYECVKGCRIDERHKPWLLAKENGAAWVPTKPENSSREKKGYHINALYAPLGMQGWGALAKEHDEVHKETATEEELQAYVNLQKGEEFKLDRDLPDWKKIYEQSPDYDLGVAPTDTAYLTAGVDVQHDRLEIAVRGWCAGMRSYLVDYRVFPGDPKLIGVWNDLHVYLDTEVLRSDGGSMKIGFTCVDSGYLPDMVYAFCKRVGDSRCVPIKGGPDTQKTYISNPRPTDINRDGKKVGRTFFYLLGTHVLKTLFYSRLRLERDYDEGEVPAGWYHFTKQADLNYFKGLCSEVYRINRSTGKGEWEKVVVRNEPLDLECYNLAAAQLSGVLRKSDSWFADEIARYIPGREMFAKKTGRQRRPSDHWNKLRG